MKVTDKTNKVGSMDVKKRAEREKYDKTGKMVQMFHGKKHTIQIDESLVECHKKCGWRLKK